MCWSAIEEGIGLVFAYTIWLRKIQPSAQSASASLAGPSNRLFGAAPSPIMTSVAVAEVEPQGAGRPKDASELTTHGSGVIRIISWGLDEPGHAGTAKRGFPTGRSAGHNATGIVDPLTETTK